MRFANTVKRLSIVLVAISQLFLCSAYASEVVGKVTAVDYGAGMVFINAIPYKFSISKEGEGDKDSKSVKDIRSLRYGHIVTYSAENGSITRISIMSGAREIPM